jgi:hypothetical protein
MDWCGEFQAMNPTPPPPPPPPPPVQIKAPEPVKQQLDEGVVPKVKFQKSRNNGSLKDIQESPLFES